MRHVIQKKNLRILIESKTASFSLSIQGNTVMELSREFKKISEYLRLSTQDLGDDELEIDYNVKEIEE